MTRRLEPLDVFDCPLEGIRQIEASAGTGKTWNICGLYLRLLLEGRLEVQRILVVTFTNAATAELRERIRQRVVDTLAWLRAEQAGEAPAGGDDFVERLIRTARERHGLATEDMLARLELALATFDEASIFTIHGFCQRALADTPFIAQMPLAMELVRDDANWVAEAANDFWRRRIAADDLDAGLAGHLVTSKDSPAGFAALLKRHLAKPLARAAWPDDLDVARAIPSDDLVAAHATAQHLWDAQRDAIEDLLQRSMSALSAVSYKEDSVRTAFESWDELLRGADGLAALDVEAPKLELLGAAKLAAATKKKQVTPQHEFFDVAQRLLDLRGKARQALAYGRLALLKAMLEEGTRAQREAKRRQRVIAFDDMLFNLHERLTSGDSPWLAGELKKRFPAALIDEFQDTDPLQFSIFRTIYTTPTDDTLSQAPLFFVGDPKQAIYSFRNADLHTYIEAGRHAAARYSLDQNQRSSEPLIRALNQLFGANPRAFMLHALDYQEVRFGARPRQPLVDTSAPCAPLQVWMLPPGDDGEPIFQRDAMAAVVDATANEIARLLAAAQRGQVALGQAPNERPLAAGDIAVLVRSNAQGTQIRQALTARGVGSVELSQASVFRSSDAEELDRVLAAMLEPARERTLKAALSTELMGLDAAAIAGLADDESALLAAVQRFAGWRELWVQRGVGFMLRQWLAAERVAGRLLARPDGERRLTNLLHLIECLHEAGERHAAPDTLLRWLQSQRIAPDADDATQLRLESDQNLVQIVTIHKSKGLEYPVVFCPFLWSAARGGRADGLTGLAYHDDDGQTVIDYGHEFRSEERQKQIKLRLKLEESAETLRLVYVALTRAVHRCVIVAGCYRTAGRYPSATGSTRSLLNWLVAGAGLSPEEWFEHKNGAAPISAAWAALADRSGGAIGIAPLPRGDAVTLAMPRPAPDTLAALPPPQVLPGGWRIGSFSAIAHGAAHDRSGVDHDLRVVETAVAPSGDEPPAFRAADDDPLHFPRGPAAGEAIHQAFENISFSDRAGWPRAIARALQLLRTMGVPDAPDANGAALRARMLQRMLEGTLETPLPLGTERPLRLAELADARRLVELEFHLPSHRLDAATLNDTLAAHGVPVPRLSFATLRGFLKGFIDLVFEHEGRWFILDWKSNHLGDTPARYGQEAMAAAMRDQGYHLQALLYLVALDRYLRRRLVGYDPQRHLGGAVYLFVRGVRPDWRDAAGAPTGVFFQRPSPALM
ncbi:MAG: exodeoxyribonuclease V subunit beta, partial [Vitreoscilla sp.]